MTADRRKLLINTAGVALAVVLLYLALKDVDFRVMWLALKRANYWWLLPLTAATLLSHLLRAWRWQLQLEGLPSNDESGEGHRASLATAFMSVMIGYMVNSAVPRLGEVVRAANLARRERLSVSAVIGTVVVERLLDLAMLVVVLGITAVLLIERPAVMQRYLVQPIENLVGSLSIPGLLAVAALGLSLTALGVFVFLRLRRRSREGVRSGILKFVDLFISFRDGILTLFRSRHRIGIFVTTILIWIGYWMMVHLPFEMLRLSGPSQINLADSWIVLAFGTIGFSLFPSPGGTGSYHYVTIATLVFILGMDETSAATYAVVNHAALTVLNVVVGLFCLGIQGSSLKSLKAESEAAEAEFGMESDVHQAPHAGVGD